MRSSFVGKLVQFGAGNIGRSFIGERFASAGFEVVFVDVDTTLVEALNERRSYRVMIKHHDGADEEIVVTGVRAVDGRDIEAVAAEIADADYIATSVGLSALPKLAPAISAGIRLRAEAAAPPIDIILAENIRNCSALFRRELQSCLGAESPEVSRYLETSVGLVETSIGKMVPIMTDDDRAIDPLWVFAEPYNTLIVDRLAFRGALPPIGTLKPVASIRAFVDRKLFIHNLGHAATSYLGFLAHPQSTYLYEVLEDPKVREAVRAAMHESAAALVVEYPADLDADELEAHIDDLLGRFTNRSLADTIYRVGRDLSRKLARDDRVIGAALLAAGRGLPFDSIARVAAAALLFRSTDLRGELFANDAQFVRRFAEGPEAILTGICGLSESDPVDRLVRERILEALAGFTAPGD
jgi:mannitol-1-phosphate 5-dehydrogenase